MRRPKELDSLDPYDAARAVDQFIEPQQSGPWSIQRFTVTEEAATIDQLRALGDGGGRCTPAGTYIQLRHEDDEIGVMMSNTPDEIRDHDDVFAWAHGRVLVHGLGLSCVVSGLLTNPEVDHIDVVELDPHIIAMVGPSYEDEPRVTIHQGNCLTYEWPEDAWWDYVWHDIWAKLSDNNLYDEDAESGISYRKLFQRFESRCERQDAWAFNHALMMRKAGELAEEAQERWAERFRSAPTVDAKVDVMIEFQLTNPIMRHFAGDKPIQHQVRDHKALLEMQSETQGNMLAEMHERAAKLAESNDAPRFLMDPSHFYADAAAYLHELREEEADRYALTTLAF